MTTTTRQYDADAIRARVYSCGVSFGWRWAQDFEAGTRAAKRTILRRVNRMGEVIYRESFAAGVYDGLHQADDRIGTGRLASVLVRS